MKYNILDNEAYAGNCLNNLLILDVLWLSTIFDSAQFLPFLAKWQELFLDHDWITQYLNPLKMLIFIFLSLTYNAVLLCK